MTATKPSIEQIRAQIISIRSEIHALLKGTHYDAEVIDRLSSDHPKIILILTSRRMNEREFHPNITIQCAFKRYSTEPTGVAIMIPKGSARRSRDRLYTNVDKAAYAKIKAYLVELEELIYQTEESRQTAKVNEARWNAVRAEQLSGMVEPPGMDSRIDMSQGPNAGKYHVRFHNMGIGLEQTPLTADQVKRLAVLVNELLQTENYHVIVATWQEQEKAYQWTQNSGWREGLTSSVKVIAAQDLPAELEKAKEQAGNQWNVKSMSYAQLFTVKP
jgi:hypothetical protein